MPRVRLFIRYWLPVLVWMGLIFCASSDCGSFQHTLRIIGPLVRRLFPSLSEEAVHGIVVAVRKCAHLGEYAVLGLLVWRARRKPVRNDPRPWQWREALWTTLLVMLYAASDEFHQFFVPSRQASVADVLLDTTGAVLALGLLWGVGRWRKRW